MKKVILALIASVSMVASAKTVTVRVCDGGESGTVCRTVTYKVRPASPAVVEKCMVEVGDGAYGPCPAHTGVPSWLKSLNSAFAQQGLTAPKPENQNIGGQ